MKCCKIYDFALAVMVAVMPWQPLMAEEALHKKPYKEILRRYTFVGDVTPKDPKRPLPTKEVFWRYPMKIPNMIFGVDQLPATPEERAQVFPVTMGAGRSVQHMNRARLLYIEGDFRGARDTLLSRTAIYGAHSEYHRRSDFYLGLIFMHLAALETDLQAKKSETKNAMAFMTNAFKVKKEIRDDFIEPLTPKYLYNMAAIFFNYGRYGGAFGLADQGLNWLRRNGKTDYRIKLRRIFAESFVRNRSYLEAIQEFDISLRDANIVPEDAARIFARVGDIYFDLNNFELAEDVYSLAIAIDKRFGYVQPLQYIFDGEALFWQGRYSDAQKMLHYGSAIAGPNVAALPDSLAAVASIRIADAWLAQVDRTAILEDRDRLLSLTKQRDKAYRGSKERLAFEKQLADFKKQAAARSQPLEKAKIGYSRHIRKFPRDHTADHARIRLACLNLPEYGGENIRHARSLLARLKVGERYNNFHSKPSDYTPKPSEPAAGGDKAKEEEAAAAKGGGESENNKAADGAAANTSDEAKEGAEQVASEGADGDQSQGDKDTKSAATQSKKPVVHKEMKLKVKDAKKPEFLEPLPKEAIHLAWGCEVASYAQHERTKEMVARVGRFASLYPQSSFFKQLEEPVRETQSMRIDEYFDAGDQYSATVFFEQNRSLLFKDVYKELAIKLFTAYVDINASAKAREFFDRYQEVAHSDMQWIRMAVFTAENYSDPTIKVRNAEIANSLLERGLELKPQPKLDYFIDRILNSPGADDHYRWILGLSIKWAEADSGEVCRMVYPLLARSARDPQKFGVSEKDVKADLTAIMTKHLGELVQFKTNCAYSYLELEQNVYEDEPLVLYERLNSRDYLPMNEFVGSLTWNISEVLEAAGYRKQAAELWRKLRDSQAQGVREVTYAKLRLDKRRTEVEKLWNN